MNSSEGLVAFGYRFMGPVLARYCEDVYLNLMATNSHSRLFFLAREGYFLKDIVEYYFRLKRYELPLQSKYLVVSRVFLFKILLIEIDNIHHTLNHSYSGSLANLLRCRYAFSGAEINYILEAIPELEDCAHLDIELPRDIEIVLRYLKQISSLMSDMLYQKHRSYLEYLSSIDYGGEEVHLFDLGYSGTIQKLLTNITGVPSIGHYFVTTPQAQDTHNCKFIGHLAANKVFNEGYALLDRSLYLEAILTAPQGQLIDICSDNTNTRFIYGKETAAQKNFFMLREVVRGAKEYCKDVVSNQGLLDHDEVAAYYKAFISNENNFPEAIKKVIEVDDSISGFGVINPLSVFRN